MGLYGPDEAVVGPKGFAYDFAETYHDKFVKLDMNGEICIPSNRNSVSKECQAYSSTIVSFNAFLKSTNIGREAVAYTIHKLAVSRC